MKLNSLTIIVSGNLKDPGCQFWVEILSHSFISFITQPHSSTLAPNFHWLLAIFTWMSAPHIPQNQHTFSTNLGALSYVFYILINDKLSKQFLSSTLSVWSLKYLICYLLSVSSFTLLIHHFSLVPSIASNCPYPLFQLDLYAILWVFFLKLNSDYAILERKFH